MKSEESSIEQLVKARVNEIAEHVECVRVFVSYSPASDTTRGFTWGAGNFHGQYGQVREWLLRQDEFVKEDAREDQRQELEGE